MMKKLTIIVFVVGLAACSPEPVPEPKEQSIIDQKSTRIHVTDFTGETITLEKPAQRIVALAPHIVENVFTAGAGEQLIGVVAYSDFPEQAKLLPLVGGYAKTNLEKILELDPDLIIAWESGNSDASVARIKELGYPVYVDQPDSLTDLAKSVRDIGTLTGHAEQANKAMDEYLTSISEIKALYESKPKVRTFYQVWNQPLRTITGKHIISDAIRLCGGTNIYADEPSISPIINIESLLERDPQAIIASGMSEARPDWLDDWKKWPSLQSVKNDNLFFVNPNHIQRHTVRILLGIESICTQLDEARAKNG